MKLILTVALAALLGACATDTIRFDPKPKYKAYRLEVNP